MNAERRFARFTTQLKGQYFVKERKRGWQECTITVVSRKGLGAEFHTREIIKPGSTTQFEITVPGELEPVTIKGILRWIKKKGNDFIGGIEFTKKLDDLTFAKLC